MKLTYGGKRYNTDTAEVIASYDHHNNGNYSGTTYLLRAADGEYLLWTDSNGQDCFLRDSLCVCDNPTQEIEGMEMDEEQEKRAVELGLIKIV